MVGFAGVACLLGLGLGLGLGLLRIGVCDRIGECVCYRVLGGFGLSFSSVAYAYHLIS